MSSITARFRLGRAASTLTVVVGLVLVSALFQSLNSNFLSARNLSNLLLQIAVLGTLAIGMSVVLIVGEIDLSVGAIAGVSAAILAIMVTDHGVAPGLAILVAIASGAVIGIIHGSIVVTFGIPSFIVTLAGLLVWQGAQLALVGEGGQIPLRNEFVRAIASSYATPAAGFGLAFVIVAATAWTRWRRSARRRAAGLPGVPTSHDVTVTLVVAVVVLGATWFLNSYFGIPWVFAMVLGLLVVLTTVLGETSFGRHIIAIGGNREAARRAGVSVRRTTVLVFVIVSAVAAGAGVIEASRQFAASNSLGGGTLQLNAIAAAVIGGVSLFGGRGRPSQALLGALIVGSVQNGLDLLGQPAAIKNVATGVILVLAVIVDAVGRRRRIARGADQ